MYIFVIVFKAYIISIIRPRKVLKHEPVVTLQYDMVTTENTITSSFVCTTIDLLHVTTWRLLLTVISSIYSTLTKLEAELFTNQGM